MHDGRCIRRLRIISCRLSRANHRTKQCRFPTPMHRARYTSATYIFEAKWNVINVRFLGFWLDDARAGESVARSAAVPHLHGQRHRRGVLPVRSRRCLRIVCQSLPSRLSRLSSLFHPHPNHFPTPNSTGYQPHQQLNQQPSLILRNANLFNSQPNLTLIQPSSTQD